MEDCKTITIGTREVQVFTTGDEHQCVHLYVVGHPIVKSAPWNGGVTCVTLEDITKSISRPRDEEARVLGHSLWNQSEKESMDAVDYETSVRAFTSLDEARTRYESRQSGKVLYTRHGVPIITVRVLADKAVLWSTLPLDKTKTGLVLLNLHMDDIQVQSAEFQGALFAPYRPVSTCVIL